MHEFCLLHHKITWFSLRNHKQRHGRTGGDCLGIFVKLLKPVGSRYKSIQLKGTNCKLQGVFPTYFEISYTEKCVDIQYSQSTTDE